MKILITGVAGFIGSTLADHLINRGNTVIGIDNFSTGKREFLKKAFDKKLFTLVEADLLSQSLSDEIFYDVDVVYHLAANADIRGGLENPKKDLEQNILVTFNLLEKMRANKVRNIVFSSSAAALGEPQQFPTTETAPFPNQTSLYGASKCACEGLISAYCEGYGFSAAIFRFVSILGPRYPHGHVYDFVKKLLNDPTRLEILGDGSQRKSYLHIEDCICAITNISESVFKKKSYDVFHLGTEEYIKVSESAKLISKAMNLEPKFEYTGGRNGWIGDNPFVFLDISKAKSYGWHPKNKINKSLNDTVAFLLNNKWIYDE